MSPGFATESSDIISTNSRYTGPLVVKYNASFKIFEYPESRETVVVDIE
jgi:hypothetical protein